MALIWTEQQYAWHLDRLSVCNLEFLFDLKALEAGIIHNTELGAGKDTRYKAEIVR